MEYPKSNIPTTKKLGEFIENNKLKVNDFKGLTNALAIFHKFYAQKYNIPNMEGCLRTLSINSDEARKKLKPKSDAALAYDELITKTLMKFDASFFQELKPLETKWKNSAPQLTEKKAELTKQSEKVDALIVQVNKWQIKWDLLKPPEKSREKQEFMGALEQTDTFAVKYEQKAKKLCIEVDESLADAQEFKDAGLNDSEKLLQGWSELKELAVERHKSQKTRSTWNLMTRIGNLKEAVKKTPDPN